MPGLYIFHYGHAKGHEFHKIKAEFYRSELAKFEGRGGSAAAEFDIIRVVEGAVVGRPGSTKDGHSTDRTIELIRNFPDPDNKIELYQFDRPFKSLEEQKQVFLDVAKDGEWLFIVDADEFYMEGDIERVRQAIYKHPLASEIIPTFLHFYRDFFHVKAPQDRKSVV